MSQSNNLDRRVVLNTWPRDAPKAVDFRIESGRVSQPEAGQVPLRALPVA